jgi:c-di-GMP-binding flagellar brake protein YcgR
MSPLETSSFNKVNLQLWEKLELEFGKNNNIGTYFSRVQDFRPDGIVIDRPLWLSGEPSFNPEESFLVSIFRDDGTYQFNATIIKNFSKGKQKLFVLKYPETLYRRQRRNYCRVESNFAVNTLKVIKKENLIALTINNKEIGIDYPVVAIVRRIEDLPENRINAGIEFLTGEAARKFVSLKQEKSLPRMLFRFNEKERQRLVQFVFGYQIKLRQKGLI